ncbi:hypothetical protein F5Y04DRAFT_287087 [Hypomontagnella monticulosa]|nr:hypothetical protein F5Y04DRAFT_287087 [Hypomontagnella monticulosa]
MERVKRILCLGRTREDHDDDSRIKKSSISRPLETFRRRSATCSSLGDVSASAMDFTPRSQGERATLAWLGSGSLDSLNLLRGEQYRAIRRLRRGPKTLGTAEVQRILREPSARSVMQLHRVREDAEVTLKYGSPGRVAYNFSRSLTWNQNNAQRLPSLQLSDFEGTVKRARRGLFSGPSQYPSMSSSISWLDLGAPKTPDACIKRPSPVANPVLVHDPYVIALTEPYSPLTAPITAEEEWEVREAKALKMTRVPIWQVNRKSIHH